jgi:enterochelin esterase-like enzyme
VISRRAFLVGAGGVLIAGSGSAAGLIATSDRLQRTLGLSHSPDRHFPRANTPRVDGQLDSKYMRRRVGWSLTRPQQAPLGIVYCLHGRSSDHTFTFDGIHLDDVAAALNLPLAIASVDGGDHSYWHARTDGTDAMGMLQQEFVPMIQRKVGARKLALLGWSMGGYGALLAAQRAPHRFTAVTAASPALWRTPQTAPGAFDGADDYARNDVFAGVSKLATMQVRIDCGTKDPFYPADKHFVSLLTGAHSGSFTNGYHDSAYWRSVAPQQLQTIAEAFRRTSN